LMCAYPCMCALLHVCVPLCQCVSLIMLWVSSCALVCAPMCVCARQLALEDPEVKVEKAHRVFLHTRDYNEKEVKVLLATLRRSGTEQVCVCVCVCVCRPKVHVLC
jgi:hypothetical protein